MMIFAWAGWDFCATRIETVTVIATRRCCTPSATCWKAATTHSLKHTRISASPVATKQWLTHVTLLISNISAQNLVRGRCQATRKVQDCVGPARVLNYELLSVSVSQWMFVSHVTTTRTSIFYNTITRLSHYDIRLRSKKAVIPVTTVIHRHSPPWKKYCNCFCLFVFISVIWITPTVVGGFAWNVRTCGRNDEALEMIWM